MNWLTMVGYNWVFLQAQVRINSAQQIIRGRAELIIIKIKAKECNMQKNRGNV